MKARGPSSGLMSKQAVVARDLETLIPPSLLSRPPFFFLDAPDWDGHEAPRLMSKQALVAGAGKEPESIRSYAWSDEMEKIK